MSSQVFNMMVLNGSRQCVYINSRIRDQSCQPHLEVQGHLQSWHLKVIGWKQGPTIIEEDNQACVYASEAKHMTRNLRHLDLAQLWFKEMELVSSRR